MNKHNHGDYLVPWRRLALVIGLSGLVGVLLLWLPISAKLRQEQDVPRWETVLDEDFDAPLSGSWILTDTSNLGGGEYYWGTATLTQTGEMTYTTPITALWSVGGGADGISLTAGVSIYTDNVDSWAIYGPLDVSQVFDGNLTFDWWLDTATGTAGGPGFYRTQQTTTAPQNGDWLGWCVLMDINDLEDCQGTYVSGSSSQWLSGTLSLKPYIQASRVTTGTQFIWIAFRFISDDDGRVGLGAFVDNLVLRLNYGFEVCLPLVVRNYPPASVLNPIPAPVDRSYEVTWLEIDADIDHYVLQHARSSDFVSADQVWTTTLTSQDVTDAYCAYYYRVRADKAADWGEGAWSNVEQGVASPPDPPVLNDIPEPDTNGHYTVSWPAVTVPVEGVAVDRYVLQESADAGFGTVTHEWQITATSQLIQDDSPYATVYYRVRADDDDCWGQGAWSETKAVTLAYYDDFTNSGSGWPHDQGSMLNGEGESVGEWHRGYKDNTYRLYIEHGGAPWDWFYQPDALAPYVVPSNKYCVETYVKFEVTGWWANAGLIFGANAGNTDLYILCLDHHDVNQLGWFITHNPDYNFPHDGCRYAAGIPDGGRGTNGTKWGDWNRIQVSVENDDIDVYMNGLLVGEWNMSGLSAMTRVGLIGGDYEITPVDIRFANIKVIPNAACVP